ncbi:MAG TPA: class I SAM-dependent methyltransferase [Capillimicrobium sp.]|jgi:SAM-dependent methyltransferase
MSAEAPYDRHAAVYDRLIGNAAYNRVVWGVSPSAYTAFAREALASGRGRFLDAGCGTAVFTAEAYRETDRELVLVDLSRGMLDRAAARLAGVPAVELVQADLHALPFPPGGFETVACFGMLHVLDDPWAALAALREQLAPGGRLFASMLVDDRAVGAAYGRLLRRRGELGPARSAADLLEAGRRILGAQAEVERIGSMAFLRA